MTIFVAGIHGVGKTYLAKPAASLLGLKYATASQLIREERGHASWDSSKRVDEVQDNQAALIAAVARLKAEGQSLILDGHLVLRTAVEQHERLPHSVFRDLGCSTIILITSPTSLVLDRLAARGDSSWSKAEVASFESEESEHANAVAKSLEIPLVKLDQPSAVEFESALVQALDRLSH